MEFWDEGTCWKGRRSAASSLTGSAGLERPLKLWASLSSLVKEGLNNSYLNQKPLGPNEKECTQEFTLSSLLLVVMFFTFVKMYFFSTIFSC